MVCCGFRGLFELALFEVSLIFGATGRSPHLVFALLGSANVDLREKKLAGAREAATLKVVLGIEQNKGNKRNKREQRID